MDLLNTIEIELTQKEQVKEESSQDKILEETTGKIFIFFLISYVDIVYLLLTLFQKMFKIFLLPP